MYTFSIDLSNPGESVIDSAEDVANDQADQHENPRNNIAA
jgi:hypothetical protein